MRSQREIEEREASAAAEEVRAAMSAAPDGGCAGCMLIAMKYIGVAIFIVGALLRMNSLFFLGGGILVTLDIIFIWMTVAQNAGLLPSGAWLYLVAWAIGGLSVDPWYKGIIWGSGFLAVLTASAGRHVLRRL